MVSRIQNVLAGIDVKRFPIALSFRTYEKGGGDVLEIRGRVRGRMRVLAKDTIPAWVKDDSVLVYVQRLLHAAVLTELDRSVRFRGRAVFASPR